VRAPKVTVDLSVCGGGAGVDPRSCCRCLQACDPAIFIMHESFGVEEDNPLDPQKWSITPMWPTLCTRCMKCVESCPHDAISVR
jgi:formate hydrogenlyase subunit 6/NADH:ubiquinone oxidoreductase subunit I